MGMRCVARAEGFGGHAWRRKNFHRMRGLIVANDVLTLVHTFRGPSNTMSGHSKDMSGHSKSLSGNSNAPFAQHWGKNDAPAS
jgi:hypothetical protein